MQLDPRLQQDSVPIGRFPLCCLRISRDSNYPWFLLIPDRAGVREIHELAPDDQVCLMQESSTLARALEAAFSPDKLNIAALGNIVPQLHVHHIVRYKGDAAWPDPVWGKVPAVPYDSVQLEDRIRRLREALGPAAGFQFQAEEEAG